MSKLGKHQIMFVYTIFVIIVAGLILHFTGVNNNTMIIILALTLTFVSAIVHTIFTWIGE